tara:strand:- start:466 stop:1347 length:882 start_codon:yes stop_codon:yes gene_type:complete
MLPDEIKKTLAYVLYMYYKRKQNKGKIIVNIFQELNEQMIYFKEVNDRQFILYDYFTHSRLRPYEFFNDTQDVIPIKKKFLLDFFSLMNIHRSLHKPSFDQYFTIHYDKTPIGFFNNSYSSINRSCFVYYKSGIEFIYLGRLRIRDNLSIRYRDIDTKNHIFITRFDILRADIPLIDIINEIASPLFEFKIDELLLPNFRFSSSYHPKKIYKKIPHTNNIKNIFNDDYIFYNIIIDFRKQYVSQNFPKFKTLHKQDIVDFKYHSSETLDIKKELNKEFRNYFKLLNTTDCLMI